MDFEDVDFEGSRDDDADAPNLKEVVEKPFPDIVGFLSRLLPVSSSASSAVACQPKTPRPSSLLLPSSSSAKALPPRDPLQELSPKTSADHNEEEEEPSVVDQEAEEPQMPIEGDEDEDEPQMPTAGEKVAEEQEEEEEPQMPTDEEDKPPISTDGEHDPQIPIDREDRSPHAVPVLSDRLQELSPNALPPSSPTSTAVPLSLVTAKAFPPCCRHPPSSPSPLHLLRPKAFPPCRPRPPSYPPPAHLLRPTSPPLPPRRPPPRLCGPLSSCRPLSPRRPISPPPPPPPPPLSLPPPADTSDDIWQIVSDIRQEILKEHGWPWYWVLEKEHVECGMWKLRALFQEKYSLQYSRVTAPSRNRSAFMAWLFSAFNAKPSQTARFLLKVPLTSVWKERLKQIELTGVHRQWLKDVVIGKVDVMSLYAEDIAQRLGLSAAQPTAAGNVDNSSASSQQLCQSVSSSSHHHQHHHNHRHHHHQHHHHHHHHHLSAPRFSQQLLPAALHNSSTYSGGSSSSSSRNSSTSNEVVSAANAGVRRPRKKARCTSSQRVS